MTLLNVNITKDRSTEIARLIEVKRQLNALDEQKKALEKVKDELEPIVTEWLRSNNYKTYENESATITIKDGYTRNDFDKAKFQKENPDIYSRYLKETSVKDTMLIKIKG